MTQPHGRDSSGRPAPEGPAGDRPTDRIQAPGQDTVVDDLADVGELEPSFNDQTLLSDPVAAAGPSGSAEDQVQEGDDVYTPPTDPVVTTDLSGRTQVLGGFSTDALESVEVERSSDGRLGDEAIEEAILRELREDAATTDLDVRVTVREGVAHLHGQVPTLDDAESAEEVAARVPGVKEVVEELEIAGL